MDSKTIAETIRDEETKFVRNHIDEQPDKIIGRLCQFRLEVVRLLLNCTTDDLT